MEILFRNPGSSEDLEITYDDWKFTRYLDAHRATSFSIKCSRRVPVLNYAKITAKEDGKIHFRGYVGKRPAIRNKTKSLTCFGDEELLLHRTTGRAHFKPDVTRLFHPFQSALPSQVADAYGMWYQCGLLFLANSLIPPTIWTLHDAPSWTWKLSGGGSSSRIGTAAIYSLSADAAVLLTERASLALCIANDWSSYRDANDLYIHIYNVDEAYFGAVLAANAFDTNVRLGQLDNPEIVLANLQMADDKPAEVLLSLADFHEQPCRFRYGSDGYTYLDSVEDDGSDDAIYELPENQCASVELSEGNDRYIHGLTGLGIGSRDPLHRWTAMDLQYKGVWYHDNYEVENGFGLYNDTGGLLSALTTDEYNRRRANESWRSEALPTWEPRPNPGHYLNLRLLDEKGLTEALHKLRIESLSIDSKGTQILELGRRLDDIVDAFNPKASLSDVYMYEYLQEIYSAATSNGDIQFGDTVHGLCAGFTGYVTVPADVDDAENNHRVTVDISINLKDSTAHIIGPGIIYLLVAGSQSPQHVFKHYMIGDTIQEVDITSKVAYGSETTVAVYCQLQGNWSPAHSACSEHPDGNCNLTFHAYKRIAPS
jgi:hypothetical protein